MNATTMEPVLVMEFTNTTQPPPRVLFRPLISFTALDTFFVVNYFVCVPVLLLGVFANIANIIVYSKLGFSESSNVNFLALSVFDFLISLLSIAGRAFYTPLLRGLFMTVSMCLSHATVVVTCGAAMITALISTERCLCVVFPLKVKTLLSNRRSLYLILTIVAYHLAFLILLFSDSWPTCASQPEKLTFYYFSLYVIPSTSSYFIVVITTIFLVIKLRRNQQWRRETATQAVKSSDKEDKIIRTIIAISTLFIICSFPNVAIFIIQIIYPSFNYLHPSLGTLVQMFFDLGFDFQAISSSMNIFFYYRMSSKFKRVFSACILSKSEDSGGGAETITSA